MGDLAPTDPAGLTPWVPNAKGKRKGQQPKEKTRRVRSKGIDDHKDAFAHLMETPQSQVQPHEEEEEVEGSLPLIIIQPLVETECAVGNWASAEHIVPAGYQVVLPTEQPEAGDIVLNAVLVEASETPHKVIIGWNRAVHTHVWYYLGNIWSVLWSSQVFFKTPSTTGQVW